MRTCPSCEYEQNRDAALTCGLCGKVFPEVAARLQPAQLFRYRKDFRKEIADNRVGSLTLLLGFPLLIVMLGFAFDVFVGAAPWGMVGALALAIIIALDAYFDGDRAILDFTNARPAAPNAEAQIINVVDEMRIAAGLPMPKVYVIDSPAANAFATGRDPQHASVAVTTGLVEILNRDELQGVIGHEMSHIRNHDIRYMMLVSALLGAVVLLSDGFLRGARWGGGSLLGRRSNRGGSANALMLVLALLAAVLAPLMAVLLQMAISRKREFLADAAAVELTRNPLALASALEKLDARAHTDPLPGVNRATQHLFIVNPLRSFSMNASALLSTHPPTEARIRVLRAMA